MRRSRSHCGSWLALLVACGCGGGEEPRHGELDASAAGVGATGNGGGFSAGAGGAAGGGAAGAASAGRDAGPIECGLAGCGQTVPVDRGRVDMLFVVDDSGSMRQEQEALAAEFPRLLRKLTSGDHDEDGVAEQTAVGDLHLAVVSTEVSSSTITGLGGCTGGSDGRFVRESASAQCAQTYPAFLHYESATGDAARLEADFSCISQLGTAGCGFEQPLEAALKALWPSADPTFGFLGRDPFGHGDRENGGFVRNGRDGGPAATLAIVLVSDEDDCSAWDSSIWTPREFLPQDSPLHAQELNLRCFYNPDRLFELDRYLHGYRALHAHTDARVLFAAIVGVPVELVNQEAVAEVDFTDAAEREAFYQRILDDPRMVEMQDPDSPNELVPSCTSELGRAYPPRRIVELARRFGPDGLVQSICGDNFGPPLDRVVEQVVRGPD